MIESQGPTLPKSSHPWGILGWARWLPEIANGGIVLLTALFSVVSLISYSDAAIRQSLVDTYEPSAWNFIGVCILAFLGVLAAVIARVAAKHSVRRRLASIQVAIMVASVAVAAFGHWRLMQRTTELTGQTFGGFP